MKIIRKILSAAISLSISLTTMSMGIISSANTSGDNMSNDMKYLHETDRNSYSVELFQEFVNNFHSEIINGSGKAVFPENYGGAYIDKKGVLHFKVVDDLDVEYTSKDVNYRVQQEIARRNSKRSGSTKNLTEQSKYSSKYALTDLLFFGECGKPCRRCRWTSHNRNRIVWRCLNRLENGPKYCKAPTIDEQPLHNAIVSAINEFYNCSDDVANILKESIDTVLSASDDCEIKQIEQRLMKRETFWL